MCIVVCLQDAVFGLSLLPLLQTMAHVSLVVRVIVVERLLKSEIKFNQKQT